MSRAQLRRAAALGAGAALLACRGATAGQETTLRFWALGAEGEAVTQLVRGFEKENPGIHVQVQQIPWTAAHEKLLTAFVGEATPDLAQLGNTWIPEFVAVDALEPLDARIAHSATIDSSRYFRGIWDTNELDGSVYGIPWYVDTRLLFYRTDILREAGYSSMPTTWEDWQKAMAAIKRVQGPFKYAIFLPTNEWTQPVIFGLQNGSPLLKQGDRFGAFSDSAFRRSFDFYVGLFRRDYAPVAGNNDMANAYQEFAKGTFAMWITGPWNLGEFKKRLPSRLQSSWATAPLPAPSGDSAGVSTAGGSSLVLFRGSQHPDAAWKLVEYLSRPEVQRTFYRLTGDLPARVESWRDSTLIDNRYAHAFWEQLQRVRPTPKVPEWEQIATRIYEAAEQTIRGNVPADSTLSRLDREVNILLDKRRWMLAHSPAGAKRPPTAGAR
ncbi:MAG: sugar ABC transporter substrate-binding protein [Gemmatimonadota bacterium]|nr:sugar ABC transporter substrate-binding protein [Gemmatimonadota bacterium]